MSAEQQVPAGLASCMLLAAGGAVLPLAMLTRDILGDTGQRKKDHPAGLSGTHVAGSRWGCAAFKSAGHGGLGGTSTNSVLAGSASRHALCSMQCCAMAFLAAYEARFAGKL